MIVQPSLEALFAELHFFGVVFIHKKSTSYAIFSQGCFLFLICFLGAVQKGGLYYIIYRGQVGSGFYQPFWIGIDRTVQRFQEGNDLFYLFLSEM